MPISRKIDYKEILSIAKRRMRLILLVSLACFFMGAFLYVLMPRQYRSTTTILIIPQRVPESYVHTTVTMRVEDRLATMRQQIMSRTRLLSLINELNLFRGKKGKKTEDELVEAVRRKIELQVRGNDSFVLSFTHGDRRLAMLTTSKLASYFIDENLRIREQQAVGTSDFLDSQLQETKQKLEAQENLVKQYRIRYMGQLPQQLDANINNLNRLQDQYRSVSESIRATEDRKMFYEAQLKALRAPPSSVAHDDRNLERPAVAPLTTVPEPESVRELRAKQARLVDLTSKYTDSYPEVRSLRRDIERLQRQVAEIPASAASPDTSARQAAPAIVVPPVRDPAREQEILRLTTQIKTYQIDLVTMKKQLKDIEKNIAEVQKKVEGIPKREQELYSINRDYENLKVSYNELLRKKLDAQIAANLEKQQKGAQFQIVDPPNLPELPISPSRKAFMAMTLLLGPMLGAAAAFGAEFFDKSIRGRDDFRKFFDVPVLVTLPLLPDKLHARKARMKNMAFLIASLCLVMLTLLVLAVNAVGVEGLLNVSAPAWIRRLL